MLNVTAERVAKQSILYSYILSQPFSVYVDAYPVLQSNLLLEAEQLQYSENGESVRVLQHKLNELSYYDDKIDGEFGVYTEHALKRFQTDQNIKVTGQTDEKTIGAIIKAEKKEYIDQIKEISEDIYIGMHSTDVKIVQKALAYFGYYQGNIDGIYGPLTAQALEIAENIYDIKLINEPPQQTLVKLFEEEKIEEVQLKVKEVTNKDQKNVVKEESIADTSPKDTQIENKNDSNIIQVARSFIGTPYSWGGKSPGGFDCSGFIQYVFESNGITIPRTVSDIWNFTQPVNSQSIGDLVFFETYKAGPSHMGIYLGNGSFIHAGESRGVEISELSNPYWKERYIGTKRLN